MNSSSIIWILLHYCSTTNKSFNFCVNDNKEIDHNNPQMTCYIYFHNSPIDAFNPKKKDSISYYKTNGIITFNKHVNANRAIIAKMFEEVNSPLRETIKG
jgi:hypothetical protein